MDDIKKFEPLWGVWKTEELIGEGSYGKVYRAVREEFGRKYYAAVKHISIPTSESQITEAISEGVADDNESVKEYFDAIAQNLINEISLMNDVKGKTNIVSYEDHLIIPKSSGVGYDIIIRMELLTGLNDVLRHKQLTNKDVIKLGIDLCSALEVCVEKGIVHRDIKPSNIFVSDNGDYKLGDFGVARELEHTTSAMSKKGTYIYMAPEVYRGESANFSADIFSLGIVMYRLLNGNRAPFLPVSAKIKPGDNENALARRMSGEHMPAPAFAEEGLAQIILKATQFDRTKRYASPTEMKNDLIRLSGGTVLERTIPIIAEPTHNSVSFQKRNAADNQGTVILFPEQEMSNPQVSNAARSNEAAYAPQMPVYNNTVPQQTNGTVYTTPASVNRPVQNPQPIAQPANYQQSVALSPITRFRVPIVALLCVLISIIVLNSTKVLNSNKEKSKTTNTTKTYVESRDITLKIMSMPSEEPVLEEVLDDFKKNYMQEHNDINSLSINVEYNEDVPYDRAPECDVFLTSAVKSLADNKEIYPIPKDSSDKIINLVGQSMANTTFYNGDYYGFPFKPNTAHIMYYNTSLYTESEVKYLDSMLAKPLGSIKRFAMQSSSWYSSTWYLTSDLGTFTNVIYGFDSPKCVETLKFVQANNSKILINSFGWEDRAALMRDGKLAAACDGWWCYYAYKAALGENFGVTMLPILGSRQMVCWGGGQYYSINAKCKEPEVALALAEYLASKNVQLRRYEINGTIPTALSLLDNDVIKADPIAYAMMKQGEYIVPLPEDIPVDWWSDSETIFEEIYHGEINAEDIQSVLTEHVKLWKNM